MLLRDLILQHTDGISLEFFTAKLKSNGVEELPQQSVKNYFNSGVKITNYFLYSYKMLIKGIQNMYCNYNTLS